MDDKRIFGRVFDHKLYYADPHEMERAKRWGRLIHAEKGLAFYSYKGVTYVAPINDPPMLQLLPGGRAP